MHENARGARVFGAPYLITRPSVEAELHAPAVGLEGHYTVELVHAATGLVKRRLEFKNLITDDALEYIGTGPIQNMLQYLAVGKGTAEPTPGDKTLGAEVDVRTAYNGTSNNSNNLVAGTVSTASPPYQYARITRVFTEEYANDNLRELGFFSAPTGGTMFNRQLFRDANGTATSITKTAADQLRVTFEWRAIAPSQDVTGTLTLSGAGTSHDFIVRAQRNLQPQGWATSNGGGWSVLETLGYWTLGNGMDIHNATTLQPTTGNFYGSQTAGASKADLANYTPGTRYRECTYTWEPNRGNFPVTGVSFGYAGYAYFLFQGLITPAIPKTDTKRLVLGMRMSWDRA